MGFSERFGRNGNGPEIEFRNHYDGHGRWKYINFPLTSRKNTQDPRALSSGILLCIYERYISLQWKWSRKFI